MYLYYTARKLLQSGEYSDLTICCGGHEFRVHRVVVCTQSRFFAAACDGEFQEAKSGKITLIEDDPRAVGRMLSYMYNDTYSVEETSDPSCPGILANLRVYTLADKYEIGRLKDVAKFRLLYRAERNWNSDEFLEMLMEVFDPTQRSDQELRDEVAHICSMNGERLMADEAFRTALMDIPCLKATLLKNEEEQISTLKMEAEDKISRLEAQISTLKAETVYAEENPIFGHRDCRD